MHIAVNTRFLIKDHLEGFGVYTHEVLQRIVTRGADDFDFYFDRPFDQQFVYSDNVRPHVLSPPARHPILFYWWYQKRLRSAVDRLKPDVLFSPDSYMPLGSKTPTVITVHDVAPMRHPEHITRAQWMYYKHFMPKFLKEAAHIITVSHFSKREIVELFRIDAQRISVIYNGVSPEYRAADQSSVMEAGKKYADGNRYFIYVGAMHPRKNVETLIQAFDRFKREGQSDVQLLLVGRKSWKTGNIDRAIAACANPSSVRQCGFVNNSELRALMTGALGLCYISLYEGFGLPVLEAMACGTPVITSSEASSGAVLAEVAGEAALLVDPLDITAISKAMVRLFDDDQLRHALHLKGIERAKLFNWEDSARQTYDVLTRSGKSTM